MKSWVRGGCVPEEREHSFSVPPGRHNRHLSGLITTPFPIGARSSLKGFCHLDPPGPATVGAAPKESWRKPVEASVGAAQQRQVWQSRGTRGPVRMQSSIRLKWVGHGSAVSSCAALRHKFGCGRAAMGSCSRSAARRREPSKTLRTISLKTQCNNHSTPMQWNDSQPSVLLHGMQGVSGSNPLGSTF